MSKQCSEIFKKVFDSKCCGIVRTCACGITHFDTYHDEDYDLANCLGKDGLKLKNFKLMVQQISDQFTIKNTNNLINI